MVNHSIPTALRNKTPTPQKSALGSIAKIASAPEEIESANLLNSSVVFRFWLQSLARELMPKERVAKCLRHIIPGQDTVEIWKSEAALKAHYRNLMVCGRIWHCPVCATRITEERRKELSTAVRGWSGQVLMVTATLRHHKGDRLPVLLDAILTAFRSMKSGRGWQNVQKEWRWVGDIRALEVTHGDNGWHPHIHLLVFLSEQLSPAQLSGLEIAVKSLWERVLRRKGYSASWEHGLTLQSAGRDVQDYIAKYGHEPIVPKWGIESEMTKAPVKKGREGGRTPMQLLSDYGTADIPAGRLWQEYAKTFKGRNQLVWSRGLRQLLNLGREQSDDEIASEVESAAALLAWLTPDQWKIVLRADIRAELLVQAAVGTPEGFQRWLSEKLEKWADE